MKEDLRKAIKKLEYFIENKTNQSYKDESLVLESWDLIKKYLQTPAGDINIQIAYDKYTQLEAEKYENTQK